MEMHDLFQSALDTFGAEAQTKKLFEEIGEFMEALCKCQDGRDKTSHLAEEIADVHIMLDQMAVMFDCSAEMERMKRYKLRRLEQRIEEAKLESNLRVLESNPPLTEEELRQMMGEPVWCVYEGGARWYIVSESLFTILRGITVYRHKPEDQFREAAKMVEEARK